MNNINLSELTLDNIGQWPMAIKLALVGMMSLMLIGLGYWVLVKPNFEQYEVFQQEEKNLRLEFESKANQAANLQAYRNQLELMQEKFGAMLRQLPAQHEMPGLLEDISKTGIASGLKFELFAPQPEVNYDFYIELPIKIKVVGDYHELAIFLSRVAEMSRIVTLHDFMIERVQNKETKSSSGHELIMDITAKIYRYRSI